MVDIAYLADEPRHLARLADWLHAQWGGLNPGSTIETRTAQLRSQMRRRVVPCSFLALEDGELLGSASLVENDLPSHPEWSPWLASVYVDPPARGRGVASALVERVAEEAKSLGVESLYLFTSDQQSLYARLGWRPLLDEVGPYGKVTVMVRELGAG